MSGGNACILYKYANIMKFENLEFLSLKTCRKFKQVAGKIENYRN